jgi:hypothetical protein
VSISEHTLVIALIIIGIVVGAVYIWNHARRR